MMKIWFTHSAAIVELQMLLYLRELLGTSEKGAGKGTNLIECWVDGLIESSNTMHAEHGV